MTHAEKASEISLKTAILSSLVLKLFTFKYFSYSVIEGLTLQLAIFCTFSALFSTLLSWYFLTGEVLRGDRIVNTAYKVRVIFLLSWKCSWTLGIHF